MKYITKLDHAKAKEFFLKVESYSTIDLPSYFNFSKIIDKINKKITNKNHNSFYKSKDFPGNYNNVNYKIYKNKNGRYDW